MQEFIFTCYITCQHCREVHMISVPIRFDQCNIDQYEIVSTHLSAVCEVCHEEFSYQVASHIDFYQKDV
jgi:hypothetical protein